ncbi:TPA: cupin fold metalloprotein, WbuC family, partial [Klebsiella pneumoniae]|nr:cupin fold metalloprotein, WbuC family [Klebsiella pneumoniae]
GNSGARESTYTITIERLPVLENPVKTAISCFTWTDAIARGPEMTASRDGVRGKEKLDVPIKFLWNYAGNTLINQHSDINKTHEILQDESKCETIVVIDNFMTSSAKYADLLLPDLMTVEQEDIIPNDYAGNMGYLIFIQPATSAKFERKPIYWILSEVAKRLGDDVHQRFTEGRTQEQWLQYLYAKMVAKDPALPAYEDLKRMGIYKRKDPNGHFVAYRDFRRDPEAHPLKTPSGKIEIYSSRLAEIAARWQLEKDEVISPLPVYASTFEGWDDPLRSQYPLQLFGFHYKARTHSSYGNVDVLPGTYVRPHRHPHTFELLLPLRGRFVVLNFDDRGTVTHRAILGETCTVLEMAAGTWHAVLSLDTGGIIFEVKHGGYQPVAADDYAHWAPAEGEPGTTELMAWYAQAQVGDSTFAV